MGSICIVSDIVAVATLVESFTVSLIPSSRGGSLWRWQAVPRSISSVAVAAKSAALSSSQRSSRWPIS